MACFSNYIHVKQWDVFTYPHPILNSGQIKSPFKLWHGWVIISYKTMDVIPYLWHNLILFSELHILKLEQIYYCAVQLFMYKHYNNLLPDIFCDFFQSNYWSTLLQYATT